MMESILEKIILWFKNEILLSKTFENSEFKTTESNWWDLNIFMVAWFTWTSTME